MRRALFGLFLLMTSPALAQQSVPNIPFESVPNPLHLPHNVYFGEASGVAVNSKGHVYVLSRGNTTGPALCRCSRAAFGVRRQGQFRR
jgi:hypothetical protein